MEPRKISLGRFWAVWAAEGRPEMTDDDQHCPEKEQVNRHVEAADLVGDGRVDPPIQ